jgi:flagellar hook-basal body complex protein FliE|tara:strand:- start:103 stop:813 length:711 start_codon:yes stop_codon:yes gene_type:complete
MKVPALLKNKYILYILLLVGIINILGYLTIKDYNSLALFVIMGMLSTYFSKNMSINLLVAIIVTSLVAVNNKLQEGFEANAKDALNDTMDSVNDVVKNVSKKMDKTKCKSDEDCPEGKCKNGECSDKKSGFKNNVPPSSPSTVNGDSDDAVGERIDYAATMEQAYDNLQNMLGKDGMKSITNETKKLVTQQKDLIGTLNSMTPILNNAKETLANLDLGDMGDVSEMIKKFTNTKKK